MVQTITQRFQSDFIYHLSDEGKFEQELGFVLRDASLLHIEEGGVVELTYGAAV